MVFPLEIEGINMNLSVKKLPNGERRTKFRYLLRERAAVTKKKGKWIKKNPAELRSVGPGGCLVLMLGINAVEIKEGDMVTFRISDGLLVDFETEGTVVKIHDLKYHAKHIHIAFTLPLPRKCAQMIEEWARNRIPLGYQIPVPITGTETKGQHAT